MFIRWQKHRSGGQRYRRETTRFRAILVESIRVDGKWRHRHVACVGSFVAETLDVEARRDFWKAANERLSIYVTDDDRGEIEAALARRVPPTTAVEDAEWQRQADESLQSLKERSGRASSK